MPFDAPPPVLHLVERAKEGECEEEEQCEPISAATRAGGMSLPKSFQPATAAEPPPPTGEMEGRPAPAHPAANRPPAAETPLGMGARTRTRALAEAPARRPWPCPPAVPFSTAYDLLKGGVLGVLVAPQPLETICHMAQASLPPGVTLEAAVGAGPASSPDAPVGALSTAMPPQELIALHTTTPECLPMLTNGTPETGLTVFDANGRGIRPTKVMADDCSDSTLVSMALIEAMGCRHLVEPTTQRLMQSGGTTVGVLPGAIASGKLFFVLGLGTPHQAVSTTPVLVVDNPMFEVLLSCKFTTHHNMRTNRNNPAGPTLDYQPYFLTRGSGVPVASLPLTVDPKGQRAIRANSHLPSQMLRTGPPRVVELPPTALAYAGLTVGVEPMGESTLCSFAPSLAPAATEWPRQALAVPPVSDLAAPAREPRASPSPAPAVPELPRKAQAEPLAPDPAARAPTALERLLKAEPPDPKSAMLYRAPWAWPTPRCPQVLQPRMW